MGLPTAPRGVHQHLRAQVGLVFPGVGWVVWRDSDALPDELVFKVNYLGGEMATFALNFSRPGAQVVAQCGWLVPANTFPENREDLEVLRVVCRNGFTLDLASMFLNALRAAMPELERQTSPTTSPGGATAFHH